MVSVSVHLVAPFFDPVNEYYRTHDHLGYIGADPNATVTAHNMFFPPSMFNLPPPPPHHYQVSPPHISGITLLHHTPTSQNAPLSGKGSFAHGLMNSQASQEQVSSQGSVGSSQPLTQNLSLSMTPASQPLSQELSQVTRVWLPGKLALTVTAFSGFP